MTPRERVFRALEFRCPDRAPRNLWMLPWVGLHAAEALRAFQREFPDDFTGPGAVLGPGERCRGNANTVGVYTDAWGAVWERAEEGVVGEVKAPPLADWRELDHYQPPWEVIRKADWDQVNRAQEANLKGQEKFLLCGTSVRPFERMQFLRGSEALYLDLGYGSADVYRLRDLVHEYEMRELEGWVRTDCDGLSFMDDWGAQHALLISPNQWREFFKPLYKAYCELIRSAGKKVFFHSDGWLFDLYEEFIDLGIDAVNSQLFCMDIEEIGRRFKGRITFWGEVDRQQILPFGTPEDCREAVRRVRRALDDGSGGLIAECEWGVRTPAENVRAVFDEWLK